MTNDQLKEAFLAGSRAVYSGGVYRVTGIKYARDRYGKVIVSGELTDDGGAASCVIYARAADIERIEDESNTGKIRYRAGADQLQLQSD